MSKTRYQHYPHRESIDRFVYQIAADGPLLVLLFGSVATGDFTESIARMFSWSLQIQDGGWQLMLIPMESCSQSL